MSTTSPTQTLTAFSSAGWEGASPIFGPSGEAGEVHVDLDWASDQAGGIMGNNAVLIIRLLLVCGEIQRFTCGCGARFSELFTFLVKM